MPISPQRARHAVSRLMFSHGRDDDTSVRVDMATLGLEHPDRQAYIPSAWWVLRWLLPRSDVRSSDVFVEFGAGKGRILLDAARRYRFARVLGVELSSDLSDAARALLESQRSSLRCEDVRIETADATAFEIPDDMTFAYFFNPFNGETFEQVMANITASLERAPRALRIIYVNPVDHDTVMRTGRFRVVRRVRTTRLVSPVEAAIYESI